MFRNIIRTTSIASLLAVTLLQGALAADTAAVPEKKRTALGLYLTPAEAHQRVESAGARTLFIDVRSRAELQFVGVPAGVDANVPYSDLTEFSEFDEKHGAYRLEENLGFVDQVTMRLMGKGLSKNDMVIVICRSGSRSARAADTLAKAGFTNVHSVPEGFEGDTAKSGPQKGHRVVNGWKNRDLPWGYRLKPTQLSKVVF